MQLILADNLIRIPREGLFLARELARTCPTLEHVYITLHSIGNTFITLMISSDLSLMMEE